ncbi:MAG TPA: tRNA (adenosine(37)-N6)-threonylcarbamoyltransferase complex ATPase subunit type 1 TsaE [Candidatus Saccharimonadales bacterium]|nr:tRNA (adenosine(37)-N6)-threonylcarbamoyltransferase complex ATPase subunit type 1 TsaE [Candidatus Saccharimonadales bacterium]
MGRELRGGEVIELLSDLGGGKTAFVRGLAKGAGSKDPVRSPSFTLSNQYNTGKLTLHHFDFYRLEEAGIMERELTEILQDPHAVVIVEWGGIAKAVLPPDRLTVRITPTSETSRQFNFSCPNNLLHLAPFNT